MTRLTDATRTVEIKMATWNEISSSWSPDCSNDFFVVGCLKYDDERDAYIVPDVEYCIEQANDWRTCTGDYYDDAETVSEDEYRAVDVKEV